MASFEFISFTIGLLLGMIILLILVWWAYFSRTFLFTYCPTQARPCGGGDYYNDPGDALANNPNVTVAEILFLNDENEMFYRRVPKNTDCVPEANQLVYIQYPQYCSFSNSVGVSGTWRETAFNSNIYSPFGFIGPNITTNGNCDPAPGSPAVSGVPLLLWDPNPIS
jgi:hypothetical protein